MTGKTIPGVPEDWATECTRLRTIITSAYQAMTEGRRGDAMQMLKRALPSNPVHSSAPQGGRAA